MTKVPWEIGAVCKMQNWRLYKCVVHRTLRDEPEIQGYLQAFPVFASTAAKCHAAAEDVKAALESD